MLPTDNSTERFIFVVCQHGAEGAAKQEIMDAHRDLRLAFSRPGFITFKVESDTTLPEKMTLRSTLARTYGWSSGKVSGGEAREMVAKLNANHGLAKFDQLHVWQRDPTVPGKRGFEPGVSVLAEEIGKLFAEIPRERRQPGQGQSNRQT